jgi:hypothetical protein
MRYGLFVVSDNETSVEKVQGMSFYLVWLLCVLGSVVLGAAAPMRASEDGAFVWRVSASALGFPVAGALAGALVALFGWTVGAGTLASVVITLALLAIARPRYASIVRFGAALLAMQIAGHLSIAGIPMLLALPIGVVLALLPAWLQARSATFAPARMHEEALLIVLALAVVLGAAPEIESGWRAATALNASAASDPDASPIPTWALGALGAAVLIGCVSRMLRRS